MKGGKYSKHSPFTKLSEQRRHRNLERNLEAAKFELGDKFYLTDCLGVCLCVVFLTI